MQVERIKCTFLSGRFGCWAQCAECISAQCGVWSAQCVVWSAHPWVARCGRSRPGLSAGSAARLRCDCTVSAASARQPIAGPVPPGSDHLSGGARRSRRPATGGSSGSSAAWRGSEAGPGTAGGPGSGTVCKPVLVIIITLLISR